MLGVVQERLLVPNEYEMWIFKYPFSRWVLIYETVLFLGFYCIVHKGLREAIGRCLRKRRKLKIATFIALNLFLIYMLIFDVTIITKNKIIDYSFFCPQGREYSYSDISKIHTGVYGKRFYFPLTHSKGDFFYTIDLSDGRKIDLTEVGGTKKDEHEYFIIDKLDIQFVKMKIPQVSSMKNIKYNSGSLDRIYLDKMQNILDRKEFIYK